MGLAMGNPNVLVCMASALVANAWVMDNMMV